MSTPVIARINQVFILLACVSSLNGCGLLWAPPGISDEEWEQEKAHKRQLLAQDAQARNQSYSSSMNTMGAIAQVAAASGGKDAAQYQQIANAAYAAAGTTSNDSYASDAPSPESISPLASSDLNGLELGQNPRFDQPANHCVDLVNMPAKSTYDQPGPGLRNTCTFPIMVAWCTEGGVESGGAPAPGCSKLMGSYTLKPNGQEKLGELISMKAFKMLACSKPFEPVMRGNTNKLSGSCVNSSTHNWTVYGKPIY